MQVRRIAWLGIQTTEYEATAAFFRDVLGLPVAFAEPATAELALPGDDRVQVFGPGHRYFALFQEHARGPVPLFEVDDVDLARAELEAAGIEVCGPTESDDTWRWINVLGPDGNLYEFGSRSSIRASGRVDRGPQ